MFILKSDSLVAQGLTIFINVHKKYYDFFRQSFAVCAYFVSDYY
jgi:hypothetical protein